MTRNLLARSGHKDGPRHAGRRAVPPPEGSAETAWLAAFVHDELLGTLAAATLTEGELDEALVERAGRALATMLAPLPVGDALTSAAALADSMGTRVHALGPGIVVRARVIDGEVPSAVAEAILGATDEAVRNSLKHADPRGEEAVSHRLEIAADGVEVRVVVADDGVGFDPGAVDPRRMGVRRSILDRMSAVPGATASVWSAPGHGTVVEIVWHREVWWRVLSRHLGSIKTLRGAAPAAGSDAVAQSALDDERRAIGEEAAPVLRRIAAGGALTPAERTDARLLEIRLRDRTRARALVHEPLLHACDAARRNGTDVLLLDDGGGDVSPTVLARVADLVEGVVDGQVTVRVLPPGRSALVTVHIEERGQVRATAFGSDGRPLGRADGRTGLA